LGSLAGKKSWGEQKARFEARFWLFASNLAKPEKTLSQIPRLKRLLKGKISVEIFFASTQKSLTLYFDINSPDSLI